MSKDKKSELSARAGIVLQKKKIRARSNIRYFQELIDELSGFDSGTNNLLQLWKSLFIFFTGMLPITFFLLLNMRMNSTGSNRDFVFAHPILTSIVIISILGLPLSFILYRAYRDIDLLNDVFVLMPPFLEKLTKIIPENSKVGMNIDLSGYTNNKKIPDKKSQNIFKRAMMDSKEGYYKDPWLDMIVELENQDNIKLTVENHFECIITRQVVRRGNKTHVKKVINWRKDVYVKFQIIKKNNKEIRETSPNLENGDPEESSIEIKTSYYEKGRIPNMTIPPDKLTSMFQQLYK
jgi:hypothetical protein